MATPVDYYAILGIGRTATADEIREAFRAQILIHHPDQHGNSNTASERTIALKAAYDVLRSPERRSVYDAALQARERPAPPAAPAGPVSGTWSFGPGSPSPASAPRRERRPRRGVRGRAQEFTYTGGAGIGLTAKHSRPPKAPQVALHWYAAALVGLTAAIVFVVNGYDTFPKRDLATAPGRSISAPEVADLDFATEQHILHGNDLMTRGDFEAAIQEYQSAIRFQPSNVEAQFNLARALTAAGRSRDALPSLDIVLRMEPGNAEAHNDRGSILMSLGKPLGAKADFIAAASNAPWQQSYASNLGDAYSGLGDYPKALAELQHAMQMDPTDTLTLVRYANALLHSGEYPSSVPIYRHVLDLDTEDDQGQNAAARAGLLDALYLCGDKETAEQEWGRQGLTNAAIAAREASLEKIRMPRAIGD